VDCTGVGCGASSGLTTTYAGSGTGVWRFENSNAFATAVGTLDIQGVTAGKTVTLLFSNGQSSTTAPTVPSLGVLAVPSIADPLPLTARLQTTDTSERTLHHASHSHMLTENRRLAREAIQEKSLLSPLPIQATRVEGVAVIAPSPIAIGDGKTWIENAYTDASYVTTAKRVCAAGTLGRKVVIWAQNSAYAPVSASLGAITDAKLAAYESFFCGTNNNDGRYAKIASVLGDAWGTVPAAYSSTRISDTGSKQDINIVIADPGATASWGGYFYSFNNRLRSTSAVYATSNEALVFFVNSRQSQNYTQSVLIHELTHMINYYQRVMLNDDIHETWLEETSAMMTEDIFDPGATISPGCLPIVCNVRDYAAGGAGISYFNWPTATISTMHYYLGGAFGAFLNRRYGPAIYAQLMTDCYTPTTNTSSFACLDVLIQNNGGIGFADEFARFGATVFGRVGGTSEPTGYGYPAKSGTLATNVNGVPGSYVYALPAFNNWWTSPSAISIPAATALSTYPYTTHTYRVDTVAAGKTSYVRTGVSIPAKTTLIVVVK
jgi:hypothetical protein